jgi:hypothetical protein
MANADRGMLQLLLCLHTHHLGLIFQLFALSFESQDSSVMVCDRCSAGRRTMSTAVVVQVRGMHSKANSR